MQAALTYLITAGEVSDTQAFMVTIEQGLSAQTRENFMTIAQQLIQQGMQQGEYSLLLRQLERKFKTVKPHYREKLAQADAETLLLWGERVLEAQTLEDLFQEAN